MAFDSKKLAPVNCPFNGNAKMYTYSTADDITAAGYFNNAQYKLSVGDVIINCNQVNGSVTINKVTASSSAAGVTVADNFPAENAD